MRTTTHAALHHEGGTAKSESREWAVCAAPAVCVGKANAHVLSRMCNDNDRTEEA
jgi:hypothetical protein